MSRRHTRTAMLLVAMLVVALIPTSASAGHKEDKKDKKSCEERTNDEYDELLDCVTLEGVREHQAAFQAHADANGGTRVAGSAGYDASADYVQALLEEADYEVTRQHFDFPYFEELAAGIVETTDPAGGPFVTDTMSYSGSGDVTGPTIPVDLSLDDPSLSTSGCDVEDFTGLDLDGTSDIVVMQRGACSFQLKAENAENAGAEAAVVFNQGTEDRLELFFGRLGGPGTTIPVLSLSFADGVALADALEARVFTSTRSEIRLTSNVIAESKQGKKDNIVMAGAHLDSVIGGPGVQDNGSGSAALLEVALNMAEMKPKNTLRFAWWGAEEFGLLGSEHYVYGLPEDQLADIALYLNFDMIGSPNHVFQIYDADESTFLAEDFEVVVPEGSIAIEDLFEGFYTSVGEPYDDSGFSGRSDYQAFIDFGIPSGGLFTGAEVIKTDEQAAIWGGTAGDQFDPCYHLACDTYDNINLHALDVNADAVAYAMLTYAYSTETVNGKKGKKVKGKPDALPEPAGPAGTFQTPTGGGLDHDHDHDTGTAS